MLKERKVSAQQKCRSKLFLDVDVLFIPSSKRYYDTYLPISGGSRPNDTSFSARCVKSVTVWIRQVTYKQNSNIRNYVNSSGNLQVKQLYPSLKINSGRRMNTVWHKQFKYQEVKWNFKSIPFQDYSLWGLIRVAMTETWGLYEAA